MTLAIEATVQPRILRAYRWRDAVGREAWKLRLAHGETKFVWAQDPEGKQLGKGECEPTLFCLKEVSAVSKVIITEGERDADTVNDWLASLDIKDIHATCTPNGAAVVKPSYAAPLCGKEAVWVSGDNDAPGQHYLERWGALLHGVVSTINRLCVRVGFKDWTEWCEREGTPKLFQALLSQAPAFIRKESSRWEPPIPKTVTDKSSPYEVADAFLEETQYVNEDGHFLRCHQGQWYGYDGKVFCPIRMEDLRAEVIKFLQRSSAKGKARGSFVSDVILNLSSLCRMTPPTVMLPARWISHDQCVSEPKSLVVQNGIVDLRQLFTGEIEDVLSSHTADFVSTVSLPFRFDPIALCPRWEEFLGQVLPDSESQQLLQEIFGYCLTYDTSQQKFFMFEGNGGNGKGVVLDVLTSLLGPSNVSSLPLESFSEKHDLVATLGKLVNITSEVGDLNKVGEGLLKQFTGEDLMHFNPKYRDSFSARPTARLVLATNVRPPFKDRSDGLWRRLIVLPFPVTISEDQRNPNLKEELKTELSGIFNWAVWGAWSLHDRGRFIEPRSSREAHETFRREANPARLFLEENWEAQPDGEVSKQGLYTMYRRYCDDRGQKALNATNFHNEVPKVFPTTVIKRLRRGGSRGHRYVGIAPRQDRESPGGSDAANGEA
jgi:P4 family phage/plasmid primase-like protien